MLHVDPSHGIRSCAPYALHPQVQRCGKCDAKRQQSEASKGLRTAFAADSIGLARTDRFTCPCLAGQCSCLASPNTVSYHWAAAQVTTVPSDSGQLSRSWINYASGTQCFGHCNETGMGCIWNAYTRGDHHRQLAGRNRNGNTRRIHLHRSIGCSSQIVTKLRGPLEWGAALP